MLGCSHHMYKSRSEQLTVPRVLTEFLMLFLGLTEAAQEYCSHLRNALGLLTALAWAWLLENQKLTLKFLFIEKYLSSFVPLKTREVELLFHSDVI